MAFVQFSQVSLAFGDRDILKQVTITLAAGTKAALSGANGSGKSTLMKVLCGSMEPDSGSRAAQKDSRLAYLPQSGIVHSGCTLREEADHAFYRGYEMSARLEQLGTELEKPHIASDSSKHMPLLEEYHQLQTMLEDSNWHRRSVIAEQVLFGLGFTAADLDRAVDEFSGGWQMRIALAKVLLENPDILLLDEPTNYLDLEARNWLEQWLKDFSGGFLLVSHDRYFLDVTVNEVYELFNGVLKRYPGNYTHYEDARRVELESLIARYEIQQQEIQKLEDFIRRFGAKATKAAAAQEKMKMLDKMERIEIPESLKKIHFSFPSAPHAGRLVLTIEGLCKSYPSSVAGRAPNDVLKNLDLTLENGDRLVVAGKNGAGKTTLLRILSGEDTAYTGTVKTGAGVRIGYFSQDNAERLTGSESMLELLEGEAPLELIPKLRDMLGAFLFRGDDVYKSVSVLSGGEKSRLALLRLLLRPINLLILDEPTNHLDLHSKDVLLDALKGFGGTVLFVSHDRGFIESLATRVLELKPGKSREFPGDYAYYLERIAAEEAGLTGIASDFSLSSGASVLREGAGDQKTVKTDMIQPASGSGTASANWEEEKKRKSALRRLEREEERILAEIDGAETQKAELEARLATPAVYSDGEKSRQTQRDIEAAAAKILRLNTEWETVAAQLEEAKQSL